MNPKNKKQKRNWTWEEVGAWKPSKPRCAYCRGTKKCNVCDGTGSLGVVGRQTQCSECYGSGLCISCVGDDA